MISFSRPQFAVRPAQFGNQKPHQPDAVALSHELLPLIAQESQGGSALPLQINGKWQDGIEIFVQDHWAVDRAATLIAGLPGGKRLNPTLSATNTGGGDVSLPVSYKDVPICITELGDPISLN